MNQKQKILIVEDDEKIASALKRKLDNEGYDVAIAKNGTEGYVTAINTHPELILLDLVLPLLDGMTLLSQLRENTWGKYVPVIILTNLSNAEALEESKEKGVFDFLVKTDWSLDDVVRKVKERLSKN